MSCYPPLCLVTVSGHCEGLTMILPPNKYILIFTRYKINQNDNLSLDNNNTLDDNLSHCYTENPTLRKDNMSQIEWVKRHLPRSSLSEIKHYNKNIKITKYNTDTITCLVKREWWQKQNAIANRLSREKTWAK